MNISHYREKLDTFHCIGKIVNSSQPVAAKLEIHYKNQKELKKENEKKNCEKK